GDPREDSIALEVVMREAEDGKRSLSAREDVRLRFAHEGQRVQLDLSRTQFEEMTGDLLDRTLLTTRRVMGEGKSSWSDVDRLLLVGGSSRMPAVQQMLEAESGMPVDRCLSPDESISQGAAIYAGLLLGSDAAVVQDMSVKNVNSHHLGVLGVERSTGRKRRQLMISRNTLLPAESVRDFKTLKDDQGSVEVNVIEGGDDSGNDATKIGRCVVSGLPAGLPARTPVEVTFQYESNGRLAVAACVPSVDKRAELEIHRAAGLEAEEIESWRARIQSGVDLLLNSETGTTTEPPVVTGPGNGVEPVAEEPDVTPEPVASTETAGGWKSRRTRVTAGDEEPT
ncbi:MAG: Hsp70 family protein, partial [Planctomycetota bacterium]|nr:Hsp70 family protein [Planctomycetota bacterium]